ncbi:MAG TPA: alkaline phosphatase PhoX [Gaiellaceae bacterium]|nr:alkaline phosphatase PhoX [Gaiellaceae bacterium]
MEKYFESAFQAPITRRALIKGIAAAGAATWAGGLTGTALGAVNGRGDFTSFRAIAPSAADEVQVPDGYAVDVVAKWGDELGDGLVFGYNCDYSAWFPFRGRGDEGLIYVSHEYLVPFFTTDWVNTPANNALWDPRVEPYRSLMKREKEELGGSIVHVKLGRDGWAVVKGSRYNRRFYADGPEIPYTGPVVGSGLLPEGDKVLGTLGNCSGCHTPWETVLTCEENPQSFGLKRGVPLVFSTGWIRDAESEEGINYYVGEPGTNALGTGPAVEKPYYGYVTEIDPFTGAAVKHTALGRIHHENVAIALGPGGRVVAYTGDDAPAADGMFFRYVSNGRYRPGMPKSEAMKLLADGQLYVAQWLPTANDPAVNSGTGVWHPLDMDDPEACAFTTRWVEENIVPRSGGDVSQFRVPRAEDCELLPNDRRSLLVALTSARGRPADPTAFGVVRLLQEDSIQPDGTTFRWTELLEGGEHTGFASPDNMAFSSPRDLWLVTDISTSSLNVPARGFAWHMNNAIFYVPLAGRNSNIAFRFANAPVEAELTGPTFNHQQRTLFLNVQHPGENSTGTPGNPAHYRSWWPEGNRTAGTGTPGKPKPSLIAVRKI